LLSERCSLLAPAAAGLKRFFGRMHPDNQQHSPRRILWTIAARLTSTQHALVPSLPKRRHRSRQNLKALPKSRARAPGERDVIPMFNPEYRENTFGKGALDLMVAVGRKGISQEEAVESIKQEKFFFSLNRYYLFVADQLATAG